MNVDKAHGSQPSDWETHLEFSLEGHHQNVDRENVLDLLVVIEDERRFHAAAALLTEDPAETERYRALVHEDSALLANIKRGLAHVTADRHLSRRERARKLDLYACRLMEGSQTAAPRHMLSTTTTQGGMP